MTTTNPYTPFLSEIKAVIKHTDIEYTFRMTFSGDAKPGQFFEVSLPKFGEAPISISGIGENTVDLTIRRVGKVTAEIFENYVGDSLFLRGPYGNGFSIDNYIDKEIILIAGGTGLSPVKGITDYFSAHPKKTKGFTLIAGFKSPNDVLFKADFEKWKKNLNVILTVDTPIDGYCGKSGMVTEYIPSIPVKNIDDAIGIVVGPPMMMKCTIDELLKKGFKEANIWISQERKMCCGIGKCGHCKIDDTYICLDGPVFNYTKGKFLKD
ncbi:anaerobic sulfite reductase subunit AsrB [Acetobacterium tundrae]|uniref:Anaerobic sulfite reductase subunit B n=1 Tax=Acetobacterium tundrae TaxID=132932 RepID=A0ABR6WQ26_9FIRM|nr:anaerobic sulfite reductase subunit AsrB [Acetobacterium tundrae]MBC3798418.1 anaerobic sulfite reductase subunit B [Acetobacterium tundrae]